MILGPLLHTLQSAAVDLGTLVCTARKILNVGSFIYVTHVVTWVI
jgi:hypothetical protein